MGMLARKTEVGKPKKATVVKPKVVAVEEKPKDREEKKEKVLPPPPAEEMEMRVYMHCKGCAKKVKKILIRFDGVEDVFADCISRKVVVKGKKAAANPMKVVEHVQKKTGHMVELISPIPPPLEEEKKEEEKKEPEPAKPEEPLGIITVVLKMHIHCNACAQWILRRIITMKGVQSAEVDLEASQVTVKGVLEEAKLAQYVYRRTGKHVSIIKSEPGALLESAGGDDNTANEENVVEGGEGSGNNNGEEYTADNMENNTAAIAPANMYNYYYPQQYAFPGGYYPQYYSQPPPPPSYFYQAAYPPPSYSYPMYAPYHQQMMAPQMFSDENPNACSIM